MSIKCLNDLFVLLEPSAILDGMDIEHLSIWLLSPNFSCDGNVSVRFNVIFAISIPNCQIFIFLKLCRLNSLTGRSIILRLSSKCLSYKISNTPAAPCPVPTHMVTIPYLLPRRFASSNNCTDSLAPVQPSG